MYAAEYMIILCEFKENSDYNRWLYRDTGMIILNWGKQFIVEADHFVFLWILG